MKHQLLSSSLPFLHFAVDGEFPESFSTVPSGQYFASIMIIVGMSVIATVVVLQYHHHDPNGGTMPKWVSCVSLKLSSSPPSLCPTWRPPRLLGFPSVSLFHSPPVSHRRCVSLSQPLQQTSTTALVQSAVDAVGRLPLRLAPLSRLLLRTKNVSSSRSCIPLKDTARIARH